MKTFQLLLVSVLALFFSGLAFAGGGNVTVSAPDAKVVNSDWIPPIQPSSVSYVFNETGVKTMLAQSSSLLQINCNSTAILKVLGFTDTTKKIFSLGLEENGYEYTFDIKNCSLWGTKANVNYNYTKSLTEKQALALAASFMQNGYLKDKVYYQLDKPLVVYKNGGGPIMYAMEKSASSTAPAMPDIEIDPNDTEEDILPEYYSFSIVYPYIINGQEVRDQYGNRIGIQLEVSADGVMSVNARLLLFKGAKRNSEKISGDEAVKFLKNGGNSPFRGQTSERIKLAAPQRVLVLFSLWRDNKNFNYLSSGIKLKSDVKLDRYAQQPYTMILSDYKIGNMNQ